MDDNGRDWLAQARRGVIELCVLQLIAQQARYGYELSTALAQLGKPLAATEGTLYPLLRRLQRDGVVEATWQESRDGPPRKYYHLSSAGRRLLEAQRAEWEELTQAVANLRNEASHVAAAATFGRGVTDRFANGKGRPHCRAGSGCRVPGQLPAGDPPCPGGGHR